MPIVSDRQGFCFWILWCELKWQSSIGWWFSQIWLHTRYELREKRIISYSWLPTQTYHKNQVIWIFFLWNLTNLGHFFSSKILCIGQNLFFFQVEIWQNFTQKKLMVVGRVLHAIAKIAKLRWKESFQMGWMNKLAWSPAWLLGLAGHITRLWGPLLH